jgi:benzil reductase ((S)-benzoin forming)
MEYYFITGTSRGIGKALAEAIIEDENTFVTGISRNQAIQHARYRHFNLDLSRTSELVQCLPQLFEALPEAGKLVLVNNAGVLGEIGYVGEKQPEDFNFVFSVNVTAPSILMNGFLQVYGTGQVPQVILNISSGAGKYALDGWASYCASKAALDLFSETVQLEQNLRKGNVKVFSIAPGIIDTEMQSQIRQAGVEQFSQVNRFLEYKESGSLADAGTVARKLKKVILNPPENGKVVFRLDEI